MGKRTIKYDELYVIKCHDCHKVFRTDKALETVCPDCLKAREARKNPRRKKVVKKALTFAEILHIADVYSRVSRCRLTQIKANSSASFSYNHSTSIAPRS